MTDRVLDRQCNKALGMESGRIKDSQISASSSFDELSTGPQNSRLNSESGSGAWCPLNQINETSHEFLQIEFPEDVVVSGIETQGRFDKGRGMEFPTGYMIEYWRTSLGRWARYKDSEGNEILEGNSDTRSAVMKILDGAIVGKIFRIIPVSEVTRTVCLRIEIHGCSFRSSLSSYSAAVGSRYDNLDLRDSTYDGDEIEGKNSERKLKNGIGKLFDGVLGEDNFEKKPGFWVGWNRNEMDTVVLEFIFSERRNFSSIFFHVSNSRKHGAELFSEAKIFFSNSDDDFYSSRIVNFEQIPDLKFETSRWVKIFLNYRVAKKIKIELSFGETAEWLLVSEVKFESKKISKLPLETEDEFELQSRRFSKIPVGTDDGFNKFGSIPAEIEEDSILSIKSHSISVLNLPIETNSNVFIFCVISLGVILIGILILIFRLNSRISKNQTLPLKITPNPFPQYYEYKKCPTALSTVSTKRYVGTPEGRIFEDEEEYAHPDFGTSNYEIYSLPEESNFPFGNQGFEQRDSPLEIQRESLEFVQNLGSGKFGTVDVYRMNGKLVAVKSLKSDSPSMESEFMKEIHVMSQLNHPNIVKVIGVSTTSKPILFVSEFLQNRDLRTFLSQLENSQNNSLSRSENVLSQEQFLSTVTQIAAGMAYLESRKFVHRDLAARNCFVDSDGTIKIGDFGMSRSLSESDYYKIHGEFPLPIRWMSPEAVFEGKFSHKNDTWALGVTLWEVYGMCKERPYSKLNDEEVIENLRNLMEKNVLREYLPRPDLCPPEIYSEILVPCWRRKPAERPSLSSVYRSIQIFQCSSSSSPRPPPPNRAAPVPPEFDSEGYSRRVHHLA
ncbi:hypothetical protein FO519_008859 [Halicephalobus sp. NKZ332]|nr:hypothetical protein FO519_008859 [Halicephalobus sp. NKZ332]